MRVAICDGAREEGEYTASLLFRYGREQRQAFYMMRYVNARAFLDDVEDGILFDAVFLETELPDLLGVTVAQRLRAKGFMGQIVFVSHSAAYALESYEVNAVGYLLKPLQYDKLCRALSRIVSVDTARRFTVQYRARTHRIDYRDIAYVESDNARCRLYCHDGATYTVYKTLNAVEQELSDNRFLRCHQSYLVNMDYICRADKCFELMTGDTVPIRCHGLKAVRQLYMNYLAAVSG